MQKHSHSVMALWNFAVEWLGSGSVPHWCGVSGTKGGEYKLVKDYANGKGLVYWKCVRFSLKKKM